jgi:hypothetical protein
LDVKENKAKNLLFVIFHHAVSAIGEAYSRLNESQKSPPIF